MACPFYQTHEHLDLGGRRGLCPDRDQRHVMGDHVMQFFARSACAGTCGAKQPWE